VPPTATNTPTATPNAAEIIYLSSSTGGTVGGVSFANEDILAFNTTTGAYSMYFDGSDVGLAAVNLDGVALLEDGTILMTFEATISLTGADTVADADIVLFTPTSLGATTAGTWSLQFDGSDVGLTTTNEDVDVVALTPDGKLVISTLGAYSVNGVSGTDEDLLLFTATSWGSTTTGTWSMYLDGSDVGLSTTTSEDVWGAWIDDNGDIYLKTQGSFSVTGASGTGADIFICHPVSLGANSACTFGPGLYFDGSAHGIGSEQLDGFTIVR
jgi:hypothetical protein